MRRLLKFCVMKRIAQMSAAMGRALNALGLPGFVRNTDYESVRVGARVRVRCGEYLTIISVNDIDVYFERLTGRIDGVAVKPSADTAHEVER